MGVRREVAVHRKGVDPTSGPEDRPDLGPGPFLGGMFEQGASRPQ